MYRFYGHKVFSSVLYFSSSWADQRTSTPFKFRYKFLCVFMMLVVSKFVKRKKARLCKRWAVVECLSTTITFLLYKYLLQRVRHRVGFFWEKESEKTYKFNSFLYKSIIITSPSSSSNNNGDILTHSIL